ncbi:phospholipase A1 2 isoform X2 [Drosophila obscura]|uniref:phospholipase A1 2 isoform X2 n=1 Tax=Drosophila obscura TaxID=7282 RepID=UPI000BA02396|nr:phospholipase A1 2 isoform X2 [Drosophila obscura]
MISQLNLITIVGAMALSALAVAPTTTSSTTSSPSTEASPTELSMELSPQCNYTLIKTKTLGVDPSFWKKFFTHLIPFVGSSRSKMQFILFKRDFADCGREMLIDNKENLKNSGFDARHPTRIVIHGWMSQSKGSHIRKVKNAYLSLTHPGPNGEPARYEDFNVIVCDWSKISTNVNYFEVANTVESMGFLLADLVRYLHLNADLHYDDVYVIGHSLGAQIAGSAGKQIQPFRFNTIYALDPAGPKFRDQTDEYRIDASDATYVESIQTSVSLGFEQPVGHATFYPNYGKNQKKCYVYGCSHKRSHDYFMESLISPAGFWGPRAERHADGTWILLLSEGEFRMGGEPSIPKNGTFYVKTYAKPPYAMGHRWQMEPDPEEDDDENATDE